MIDFLEEWLKMRAGAAPVWVTYGPDHAPVERVLKAVDAVGVVFHGGQRGEAFPWHAIYKITPKP
ncbi:hypothetical protein [Sphingobium fuliginis]|uniref:Uncharacterized protein n=1 Tax=Sphingobium fuliginis ATCC 27551 TaxID=1208342 RepID=A0A5B8CJY0_SPHSA|nr:hypothetical protein [Sphingobium fuliginis]QDC37091.1 hypothetical protein FIL70_07515 [Sphingobium fuliginis ATCC 27551]